MKIVDEEVSRVSAQAQMDEFLRACDDRELRDVIVELGCRVIEGRLKLFMDGIACPDLDKQMKQNAKKFLPALEGNNVLENWKKRIGQKSHGLWIFDEDFWVGVRKLG